MSPGGRLDLAIRADHHRALTRLRDEVGDDLVGGLPLPGVPDADTAGLLRTSGEAAALAPVEDHRDSMTLRPLVCLQCLEQCPTARLQVGPIQHGQLRPLADQIIAVNDDPHFRLVPCDLAIGRLGDSEPRPPSPIAELPNRLIA